MYVCMCSCVCIIRDLFSATALKYNTILEDLFLGDNDLQAADGVSIGAMLNVNRTLQLLDLRNNSFRVSG